MIGADRHVQKRRPDAETKTFFESEQMPCRLVFEVDEKMFNASIKAVEMTRLPNGAYSYDVRAMPRHLRLESINQVIGKHVTAVDIRRLDQRPDGFDVTYLLDIASTDDLMSLSKDLQGTHPGITITFLDQNGMPGI